MLVVQFVLWFSLLVSKCVVCVAFGCGWIKVKVG